MREEHDEEFLDSERDFDLAIQSLQSYRLPDSTKQRHRRMLAQLPEKPRWSDRRRICVVLFAALVFIGTGIGTAAAFGVFSAPPTDRSIAHCYATDNQESTTNHFDITVAYRPGAEISLDDAASKAMEICSGAWQQGMLSSMSPHVREDPMPPPWNYPVPALIACVLNDGQVAIFPGTPATCEKMNLPIAQQ